MVKISYDEYDISSFRGNMTNIHYDTIEEVLALENYDEITSIIIGSDEIHVNPNPYYELPEKLPKKLLVLACGNNAIDKLPELPDNLIDLVCNNNKLTEIPSLPKNLRYFRCSSNKLEFLPELPENLICMMCHDNKLKILPPLPQSIQYVSCYINNLTEYPIIYNVNNLKIFVSGLNPIDKKYIDLYFPKSKFGGDRFIEYFKFKIKTYKKFIKKIEEWYLEVRYSPVYAFCRKKQLEEFNKIYEENDMEL